MKFTVSWNYKKGDSADLPLQEKQDTHKHHTENKTNKIRDKNQSDLRADAEFGEVTITTC